MFVERFNNQNNLKCKANVLINDDGLQKIKKEEQIKRIKYYDSFSDCFYIARPLENRCGKFKKASNMNFGLKQILSINREEIPLVQRTINWIMAGENEQFMYKKSVASTFEIGKYILLLDSDSKFNPFSLDFLIEEMELSPDIGYLQIRTNSKG